MLTVPSTTRESKPPGAGAFDDPLPDKARGRIHDRGEPVAGAGNQRLGAHGALRLAEGLHDRAANLASASLEGGLTAPG